MLTNGSVISRRRLIHFPRFRLPNWRHIDQTPEDRHIVTAKLGAFRSSMLQDVDTDRPVELDAIVGAVRELGQRLGVATPNIDALLGLTRLFGRVRGLYPDATS